MVCPICLREYTKEDEREIANGHKICKTCYGVATNYEPEFITADIKEFLYMIVSTLATDNGKEICAVSVYAVLNEDVEAEDKHLDVWLLNVLYIDKDNPVLETLQDKLLY